MLSVSDALGRIVGAFAPLATETVSVADGTGRVLAEPVIARLDQPSADLSAMDGYAVIGADCARLPATLKVVGSAPAGGSYDQTLRSGEAVRIFTGGPLPTGADTIVIQENTRIDAPGGVTIVEGATPGRHIRRKGLDFSKGAEGIAAGHVLTPRDVALAAAMNVPWLTVWRRPRVAILATGDELVMPGEPVGPNRIVSSSGLAVAALVKAWGGEPTVMGIARDDRAVIGRHVAAAKRFDLLVTLGGASVGDHDLVQDVLKAEGFSLDFWRIAMRPGKPLMFADTPGCKALGLPGNPVSTLVCALLFLRPAIERMSGLPGAPVATTTAILSVDVGANDTREDYVRATLSRDAHGALNAEPFKVQDSSMLGIMARANGFIVRPAHDPARRAGEAITVVDFGTMGGAF
ncbi:MAG: molybdopterin molybdotransferase MoeA [Alphaproteobacteria bacterium]|nr:molybdopterin molybdotransferase MoeA [Alphaproteobacteria bacterium]